MKEDAEPTSIASSGDVCLEFDASVDTSIDAKGTDIATD